MKKLTRQDKLFFLVTIFVIVVDQITKLVVRNTFELKQSLPVIKGFFHLTHTLNTGSGFSLLKDQNIALIPTVKTIPDGIWGAFIHDHQNSSYRGA